MKELGEDPRDFDKLRESLRRTFRPQDGFEEMLINDMTEIRWRRQRLLRAESGIRASQKQQFEIDREWRVASRGKGVHAEAERVLIGRYGVSALADSPYKFLQILEILKVLRFSVEAEGFQEGGLNFLNAVYGPNPGLAAVLLKAEFETCRKQQYTEDATVQKTNRDSFLKELDAEIASFGKLALLSLERDAKLTEPMKYAKLLPSQEDLDKIMPYEAALERQFKEKL